MNSHSATYPRTDPKIQAAKYQGDSHSLTAIPPMTTKAAAHTCCQKSLLTSTRA